MVLLAAAVVFYITGCAQPKAPDMLKNDAQKKEIFSAILNNEQAVSEMMDSIIVQHRDHLMMKMHSMTKGNAMMEKEMMGKMMEMCNTDTSMCKMMMSSMQTQPNVMKSMKGMCDMPGMKMGKDKQPQHSH